MTEISVQKNGFVINEHITLRLTEGKTVLYVDNEPFRQCMRLVLQIPLNELVKYDSIDSIDEAAELNKTLYENHIWNGEYWENEATITPEQEFWGHCSNIQAWYESDYDTRLIHSNLAFPLLERLAEVGDQKGRAKLKDEIALGFERWLNGPQSELAENFLTLHTLLRNLSKEEQNTLFRKYADKYYTGIVEEQIDILVEISQILGLPIPIIKPENKKSYNSLIFGIKVENGEVIGLGLFGGMNYGISDDLALLNAICKLTNLKKINLGHNKISRLPDVIGNLTKLEKLDLWKNEIKNLPEAIGTLSKLSLLRISDNQLIELPESIGNLSELKELYLNDNKLTKLPESIGNFISLEKLALDNNPLKSLPYSIGQLKSLKKLYIMKTNLKEIPESFINLVSLRKLALNPQYNKKLIFQEWFSHFHKRQKFKIL